MTGELYIHKRHNHYVINKTINYKNRIFGHFNTMEEAIFARKLLIEHDWDLNEIRKLGNVIEYEEEFLVVTIYKNQLRFLSRFKTRSGAEGNAARVIDEFVKNPFGGKYGIYIYKRNEYFDVRKYIGGNEIHFGIYKTLDDATFARDLLMKYDWDMLSILKDGPVHYSQIHNQYVVVAVFNDKLKLVKFYDEENDAFINAMDDIENYKKSLNKTGEKYIVPNGNQFAINYYTTDKKHIYFGSFAEKIDAITVRDILIENDWDLSKIDENMIYEMNNFFWKLHVFEGIIKVVGKYTTLYCAENDFKNLSHVTLEDLYDPNNQYSKVNKHITKKWGKFWIRKKIDGEDQFLGPYGSRQEAIDARDYYESTGWKVDRDHNSIFSQEGEEDIFSDIVSNLSMWQKIIYDTIVRIDKVEFTFDDLINHSYLKRYKSGNNFEEKVKKYLNELVKLGLVLDLGENHYLREFN